MQLRLLKREREEEGKKEGLIDRETGEKYTKKGRVKEQG